MARYKSCSAVWTDGCLYCYGIASVLTVMSAPIPAAETTASCGWNVGRHEVKTHTNQNTGDIKKSRNWRPPNYKGNFHAMCVCAPVRMGYMPI